MTALGTQKTQLSDRVTVVTDVILPKIQSSIADREHADLRRKEQKIDLGTAENALLHSEISQIYQEALSTALGSESHKLLPYPNGFGGDPELKEALASLFNAHFQPRREVLSSHIVVAPGATTCLESMLHCICDAGDAVLVPVPYWNGFNVTFTIRPSARIIPVGCDSTVDECLSSPSHVTLALETAISTSECPIRALVLTNPHNPFGRCYDRSVVAACAQFCQQHNLHFISDEVYALSTFGERQHEDREPGFPSSALQLDLQSLGVDEERVHVVWSTSKDFGSSGVRLGAVVSQASERLRINLALASNIQVSSLAAIATTGLLKSPKRDLLVSLNKHRLKEAHGKITAFLRRQGVHYIPATAGPFIFAKLPRYLSSLAEEQQMVGIFASEGVTVGSGANYAWSKNEFGWIRITFALEPRVLEEGLRRLDAGLQAISELT